MKDGLRIEYVGLGELRRWPRNPKQHDLGSLHSSIARFGYVNPIIINEATGHILAGHGRLDALQQRKAKGEPLPEGLRQNGSEWLVPVVRGVMLPSEEAEAYAIADNRISEIGGWDDEMLATVLSDLAAGAGLDGVGYDEDDLDEILRELRGAGGEEDEGHAGELVDRAAELQAKWGTATGQIWELGDHRLAVGDCTDRAVVERVMRGERAGAVVTDPPYGIEREGILNDDPEGLRALYDGCLATMPVDNATVIAFQSPRLFWVWLDAVRDAGCELGRALWFFENIHNEYAWRGWYMHGELILVSAVGQPDWPKCEWGSDTYCHAFKDPRGTEFPVTSHPLHPALKPLWIVEDLIQHTSGNVYDPFVGSGTTIVACQRLGRKARAIEVDPGYCAVTLQRFLDLTALEPVRATAY